MINNQSDIILEFNVGHCNGTMKLEMHVDDHCVAEYSDIESDKFIFRQSIAWPATIKIIVSNKNLSKDTKVDSNGEITADKFIELKKILVDNIDPGVEYMKNIMLDTGNDKINSLYWGFNGTVYLTFDQCNSFMWHLTQRVILDDRYVTAQGKF